MTSSSTPCSISFSGNALPAIWQTPDAPSHALLLAHGASLSSAHPGMGELADGLAAIGVATLRFDFPFRALRPGGGGRPDPPKKSQAALVAAWEHMASLAPDIPRLAGGRSFGSRIVTMAAARGSLPDCAGLLLFAWSLHGPGKPTTSRADHLKDIAVPSLFCRGEEDPLADHAIMCDLLSALPNTASISLPGADHSFQFAPESGDDRAAAMDAMLERVRSWLDGDYKTGWGESLPIPQLPAS